LGAGKLQNLKGGKKLGENYRGQMTGSNFPQHLKQARQTNQTQNLWEKNKRTKG